MVRGWEDGRLRRNKVPPSFPTSYLPNFVLYYDPRMNFLPASTSMLTFSSDEDST